MGLGVHLEYDRARVYLFGKNWREARAHLTAALSLRVRRAEDVPLAYLRLAEVNKELGGLAAAKDAANRAIETDRNARPPTGAADAARALLAGIP